MLRFAAVVVAFFVTATVGLASPAAAQSEMLTSFTVENVSSIIQELGGTDLTVTKVESNTHIGFKLGGEPVGFMLNFCDADKPLPGCLGLWMMYVYDLDASHTLEVINQFNVDFGVAIAVRVDNNKLGLARFVFAPGGVTNANVKSNYSLLAAAPGAFAEVLKGKQIVSIEPARPGAALSVAPAPQALRRVTPSAEVLRALTSKNAMKALALKPHAK